MKKINCGNIALMARARRVSGSAVVAAFLNLIETSPEIKPSLLHVSTTLFLIPTRFSDLFEPIELEASVFIQSGPITLR